MKKQIKNKKKLIDKTKKSNKINIIMPIVVLILIVLIDISVIFYMRNKSLDSKKDLKQINTLYNKVEKEFKSFSSMRDEFYKNKSNDFFLDSMGEKVSYWNSFIPKYKNKLDNITETSNQLIKLCKKTYINQDANSKCNIFKRNYEMSNNYYVRDIDLYLKFANEYNKVLQEKDAKLNIIDNKYKYIDIDENNVYEGKVEGDVSE